MNEVEVREVIKLTITARSLDCYEYLMRRRNVMGKKWKLLWFFFFCKDGKNGGRKEEKNERKKEQKRKRETKNEGRK